MAELTEILEGISFDSENKKELNQYEIVSSNEQTKKWRTGCTWYKNGKKNECEKYQLAQINALIGIEPMKCKDRFYIPTIEIKKKANPMKDIDGFEYTEDFDGKLEQNGITCYFNLNDENEETIYNILKKYVFIGDMLEFSKSAKLIAFLKTIV